MPEHTIAGRKTWLHWPWGTGPARLEQGAEAVPAGPAAGTPASRESTLRRLRSALRELEITKYAPATLPFLVPVLLQVAYRGIVSVQLRCQSFLGFQPNCDAAPRLGLVPFDSPIAPSSPDVGGEVTARLAWLATVVLLAALCFAVWMMSCYWVIRCIPDRKRGGEGIDFRRLGYGAVLLVPAAVVGWLVPAVPWGGVQDYVVEAVFSHVPDPSAPRPSPFAPVQALFPALASPYAPEFQRTVSMLNLLCSLLSAAAVTLGLAACMTVGTHCTRRTDTLKLSESMRNLQHVLFAGALLLIGAVIEFRALFTWAAASSHADNLEAVAHIGSTAAATLGTVYALALAAIYFPAALILSTRARDLARKQARSAHRRPRSPDIDRWLQDHGLVFSTPKSLSTLAAVLSPLLAQAPIAALLDLLK